MEAGALQAAFMRSEAMRPVPGGTRAPRTSQAGMQCQARAVPGPHTTPAPSGPIPPPPSFRFQTRFVHDISIAGTEHGSVFMDGSGVDLNLDHHR